MKIFWLHGRLKQSCYVCEPIDDVKGIMGERNEAELWLKAYKELAHSLAKFAPEKSVKYTNEEWADLQARDIYDKLKGETNE